MNILFNSKFLNHNHNSEAEGSYRIEQFPGKYKNTEANGEEYISLVHTKNHKKFIHDACMNKETVAEVELTPSSYEAAISAIGLTIKASEQGDFAVVRPSGHHAGKDRAAGFCFFNNIAIAAQKLVNDGKKVFIFDFDGHHGDGTQNIFYESDKVLYCSVHQMWAYPYTGFPEETGSGIGKGYTLNIPLIAGSGDMEFYDVINKVITAAKKFNPDVVGISAGFDAYEKDRLLALKFTKRVITNVA